MKLENQVCTFEQGKMLKKLGLSQNTLFYATIEEVTSYEKVLEAMKESVLERDTAGYSSYEYNEDNLNEVAAQNLGVMIKDEQLDLVSVYSVAELGQMLPYGWNSDKGLSLTRWFAMNENEETNFVNGNFETQAQCYAAILIYLLENSEITFEKANQQLNLL